MKVTNQRELFTEMPAAFKVKISPCQSFASASGTINRDRAEFSRRTVAVKCAVGSKLDTKAPAPEQAVTSGQICDEIQKVGANTSSTQPTQSTDTSDEIKLSDLLKEQIKGITELLSDKSNGLSDPLRTQLEKIRTLLIEQEKTDPNAISKPLQKEMDKLSEMLSGTKSSTSKTLSEMLEEQKNKLEKLFSHIENSDNSLGSIKNKIRQGKKLTASEQQLLSAKDPDAYESYRKISSARTMFRCSLNNCRTRDDVIGMRLSNALSALGSYKKAIREGGDGSNVVALNAAFENELRDFAKSPGYRSLPTAAECNKFDRDLAKAKKYEREKRLEKQREQQRLRCKKYKKKAKKTPGDGKRTVAQVLSDPTSRKVMASRAKRTYCGCAEMGFSMYKSMNSKA